MKEQLVTPALARRFLLGDVDDSERERIERLFVIDSSVQETILMAEEDLFEDYFENGLTGSDAHRFLARYSDDPGQRRKLRIARSIKEYAREESQHVETGTSAVPKMRRFGLASWPKNRRVLVPVAVALAIAMVIGAVWSLQTYNRKVAEKNRRLAFEKQLTELNAPTSFRENSPEVFSLVLPPVSLRSVGRQANIAPQNTNRVVELRLLWPRKEEYQSYLAVLRRVGGQESFTIPNVYAEKNPTGTLLRLRIPVQELPRGRYQITLSGIRNGVPGSTEEYGFGIGG